MVAPLVALLLTSLALPAVAWGGYDERALATVDRPEGLHAFLLRADEPERPTYTFPRTPAFGWDPVPGAESYEFELSTSRSFAENAIVWSDEKVEGPLMTVPLQLPWITGAKYSWFARVRAKVDGEEGPWSAVYGFNTRAGGAPRSLSTGTNPQPGMVRWTPVEGATAYEVVFLWEQGQGKNKKIKTATTAADLREVYSFHNGQDWANVTYWRARAVRELFGTPKNNLPVVSYGPWSGRYRTVEPPIGTGSITLLGTISRSRPGADVLSSSTSGAPGPGPHELVPGFWWNGVLGPLPEQFGACPSLTSLGVACPLFRVYVYTDADCVNRVHVSDLVGSPAYVPRLTKPLNLPKDRKTLIEALSVWLGDGEEGKVLDAGSEAVTPSGVEAESAAAQPTTDESGGTDSTSEPGGTEPGSETDDASAVPEASADRKNGLWDDDWPTGRYYWTVVPVIPVILGGDVVEYREVVFGQDMCADNRVMVFGKTSAPAPANEAGVPYASGMIPSGRLAAATTGNSGFFGKVLVAWKPAPGAQTYEVQWSRRLYPWRTAGKLTTAATSALLDLEVGRWFYRVRGLDRTLPGPPGMTWSEPAQITIVPRTFEVQSRGR